MRHVTFKSLPRISSAAFCKTNDRQARQYALCFVVSGRKVIFRGSFKSGGGGVEPLLRDVLKDSEGFANGLFESIAKLRAALLPGLRRYWENAALVLSLVGRPWVSNGRPVLSSRSGRR